MYRIAVITALSGERESLVNPPIIHSTADYFAFVDRKWDNATVWNQLPLEKRYSGDKYSDRRNAKYYKVLPHRELQDYDYWIWTDVSHAVIENPKNIIIEHMQDADIGVFKHTQRNCLFEEASILKELGYDHIELIDDQIKKYNNENMPKQFGLYELPVSIRKNNKEVREFNEMWWKEICDFSSRDQLSFPYCLFKSNIKLKILDGYANGCWKNGVMVTNNLIPQVRIHVSSGG